MRANEAAKSRLAFVGGQTGGIRSCSHIRDHDADKAPVKLSVILKRFREKKRVIVQESIYTHEDTTDTDERLHTSAYTIVVFY